MNESDIGSDPEDTQSLKSFRSFSMSTASLLDNYVGQARESLGVESHLSSSRYVYFVCMCICASIPPSIYVC